MLNRLVSEKAAAEGRIPGVARRYCPGGPERGLEGRVHGVSRAERVSEGDPRILDKDR
jgi:hypothetical protein